MKLGENLSWFLLIALITSTIFTSCDTKPDNTGTAQLGVSVEALSATDVDKVTITVSGDNINPDIVRDLHFAQGHWKGIIGGIPAGTDRTFFAEAFDSGDNLIYEGEVDGVEIIQGEKASVIILLQQKNAPDPFENTAPTIDSIVASSTAVSPDDPVNLEVAASDVDPGDTLTYLWSADGGTFDDADSLTPIWTAPATEGVVTLIIEVIDNKNASRAVSLDIDVRIYHGRGRAAIEANFNTWPEIAEVNADPSRLDINQTTQLSVIATDNDSDTLSYSWVDNGGECAGTFNISNIQSPTWTSPGILPGPDDCILTVTVTDGRGGINTGSLKINMGEDEDPNVAPDIELNYQSTEEATGGEIVYLEVTASDADGDNMDFVWAITSGNGTLTHQSDTADTSSIEYISDGYEAIITITVTDSNGAPTEYTFTVNDGVIQSFEEFLVNTYTTDDQNESSTSIATDGSFVIVWKSMGQDGSTGGIYGQRYDSDGNTNGSEFQVNTYTSDNQADPQVAMAGDGSFIVVWYSQNQDGSNNGIYGQRYASDGNTAGSEFLVNTYTSNNQDSPSVSMAGGGAFIVVWQSNGQDGDGLGIYGQRYNSDGSTAGSEFIVNTYTTSSQNNPSVTMADNGSFIVVWQSNGQDGDSYGIFGQRYDSGGNTAGSEFQVNTYATSYQGGPSVAVADDGSFTVVWASLDQDGDSFGIYGQRYDFDGAMDGSEFQVNTYTTEVQTGPFIAMAGDGSFNVVWSSRYQDSDGYGIYSQNYDSTGTGIGNEFLVNDTTAEDQGSPKVVMLNSNTYVITWVSDQNGSEDIFAEIFE